MRKLLATIALMLIAAPAAATVSITTITFSGSKIYGSTATLTVTGAGTKSNGRAAPEIFADWENAATGIDQSTWSANEFYSVQEMERKTSGCLDGDGCAGEVAGWESGRALTLLTVTPDVGNGGLLHTAACWEGDLIVYSTDNWKNGTRWYKSGVTKPNVYNGQQIDGGGVTASENGSATTGLDRKYHEGIYPETTWECIDEWFKLPSGVDAEDGEIYLQKDGRYILQWNTWRHMTTAFPDRPTDHFFQSVHTAGGGESPPPAPGLRYRVDNYYMDTSHDFVAVSTSPTWAETGRRFYLPATGWADTEITVAMAFKAVEPGDTIYFYVGKNRTDVNASGAPIVWGGAGDPPAPAPTVDSVTPAVVVSTGGTTVALVGANIVDGAIVKIGTTTADSTTFVSDTALSFVTPSVPAGTYDVTVQNPNADTGTLTDGIEAVEPEAPPTALGGVLLWIAR